MIAFSSLIAAFSALSGVLATPLALDLDRILVERGLSNFTLGRDHILNKRATVNYDQNYQTGGDVIYTTNGATFTVDWSTSDDFVVGLGWNPGSTFSTFGVSGSGTSLLSVYGWSTNPLVEYYIIEEYANQGTLGTTKGSLSSDGSEYTILFNTRVNEPSIQGTSTFNQFISLRQSPRKSGTITVENHFNAWKALGMDLGTLNFQVMAVESFNGVNGAATVSVSN